ncbi:hypothetical protein NW752_011300 [Fusarium irregulare]|uniref:Uncharacterized protein n=1 Tax=Fusarium irregulare TaxID=2494466 RepID=A0A9W8PFW0_9HYPO|nr:hypothetical protein NW766_011356 [Fusarium irregulare]KAJ4005337.1 hypothetical protein NW752_011300 [Fusarium irregulare]
MSPDTASSLFPDRPIRPLPKRRLREKLSPEIADTIKYPPSTHEATPLFYYPPYTLKDEGSPPRICSTSPTQQGPRTETGRNYTPRQNGLGLLDGDDEEAILRSTLVTRSPPKILTRAAQRHSKPDQARSNAQPPLSATSSMDGYDLFENTNNKKKRKIPSAGDAMLNGTQSLNNEIGSLAISAGTGHSPTNEMHNDRASPISSTHPNTSTFITNNHGISGPGRGRLGRSRNARSPLRALSDCNNPWFGRGSKTSQPQWASDEQEGGIISNAIANAEKLRPLGQENVSLLQQHSAATKGAPASTQFTFTCDSQVPGNNIQWPGHASKHNMPAQAGPGYLPHSSVVHHDGSSIAASRGSGSSRQDSKRRLERSLERAARRRRQAATEARRANPESTEHGWICEFCEYESIFGEPPRALIRTYEIKDRKRRQEEADRKRLLEKAKAKSRKGRKGGKASSRDHAAAQPPPQDQGDHMDGNHHHPAQSEGDEEEYPNLSGERTGPDIRSEGPPS